jgi:CHRD domain
MNTELRNFNPLSALIVAFALCLSAGIAVAADLKLSGANEVPPVTTAASGTGTITVAADGSVSGSVKVTGVAATMAHIHMGAAGKNGPVLIPLTQTAPGEWSVPVGAKLDTEQMKSYKAGELYVNVHSEANKGGEIRAQIIP